MANLADYHVIDGVTEVLAEHHNSVIDSTIRGELSNIESLAADKTLIDDDFALQVYTPTAARVVTLPAVATTNHPFYIVNSSATYALTVKNAGGTTISVIGVSSAGQFASNGAAWYTIAMPYVAPSTSGNVLTSNGSAWTSAAQDGWISPNQTWTYATASTFTVSGDVTGTYKKGTRLKFTQTTVKYAVVVSSVYSSPNTTITIAVNTNYVIADTSVTPISANYYSYYNPPDYPSWFTFTSTVTGFSSISTATIYYSISYNTVTIQLNTIGGTSNATNFIFTVPVAAITSQTPAAVGAARDNTIVLTTTAGLHTASGSANIAVYKNMVSSGGAWTASGTKDVWPQTFAYPI